MGADGGTVLKRSDLVRTEKESNGKNIEETNSKDFWITCGFSGKPLSDPVVSDWKGRIFNKQEILEYLLGYEKNVSQKKLIENDIKSIKDVVELKREFEQDQWVCTLTNKILYQEGQSTKFAYIPECGHVGAQSVLEKSNVCPFCSTKFSLVVTLNGQGEDLQAAKDRIASLKQQGLRHSLKPLKSKKKVEQESQSKQDKRAFEEPAESRKKSRP